MTPAGSPEEEGVWPPRPTLAPPVAGRPPYLSPVRLSRWIVALLSVGMVLDVVNFLMMLSVVVGLKAFHFLMRSRFFFTIHWFYLFGLGILAELLVICIQLAAAICFLVWTYRLAKNLRAFGVEGLRFTPAWAVGYFFVPILSFYRPYQAFREIWRASDPAPVGRVGQDWQRVKPPSLLLGWWTAWIVSNAFGGVIFRALDMAGNYRFDAVVLVLNTLSALLAILVVRRLTERQEQTAAVTNAG